MIDESSILKEFRVTLETVTPLFLGGAEPRKNPPELRPPSIRGALRYWLRAITGGITRDDLSALKTIETGVFGSASDNEGGSSPVLVRKAGERFAIEKYTTLSANQNGLGYLWFAARRTEKEKERCGLSGKFDLRFSVREMGMEGVTSLARAYAALWLLTRLGGIGTRVHRGAGCVQAASVNEIPSELKAYVEKLHLEVKAKSIDELSVEISKGISLIRRVAFGGVKAGKSLSEPPFDILDANACEIRIVDEMFDTWEEALNSLGKSYKGFRLKHSPDLETIKKAQKTGSSLATPIERSEFGLPIPFFDNMVVRSTSYDRRSSPLCFHVTKLAGVSPKYAIVIVWFKSKFLPDMTPNSKVPEKLVLLEENKKEHSGNQSNAGLINSFLYGNDSKSLPWELVEVTL